MKIMISQPMRGRSNEEIFEERKPLIEKLESKGHEVVNTIFDITDIEEYNPIKYLAKSIEAMADVDGVVFMKNWQGARGCVIEYNIAKMYGKFIKEESD